MAPQKPGNISEDVANAEQKLKPYLIAVAVLVALMAISFLLVPSGGAGAASRCGGLLFQQSKYGCIQSAAIYSRNSTMCGSIPQPYRNYCYLGIAVNGSDATLCGKINSTALGNQCYIRIANRTGNTQICGMANASAGSACYYGMAVKIGNDTACASVYGADGQAQCNDTIKFNDALRTDNATFCSRISSNDNTQASQSILQNSSIGSYAQLGMNISQLMDLMVFYNQSIGARDICYASIAYESLNRSQCASISNANLGDFCYSNLNTSKKAVATNSTFNLTALYNTCTGSSAQIDSCRYTYMAIAALQTGNLSMCKSIPQNYSSTCFYYLAKKYNSTKYCSYISNATLSSACVGNIEGLYPQVNTSG